MTATIIKLDFKHPASGTGHTWAVHGKGITIRLQSIRILTTTKQNPKRMKSQIFQ